MKPLYTFTIAKQYKNGLSVICCSVQAVSANLAIRAALNQNLIRHEELTSCKVINRGTTNETK